MKCKYCGKDFDDGGDNRRKVWDSCQAKYQRVYYEKYRDKRLDNSRRQYLQFKLAQDKLKSIQEMIT